jgi:PAS domain S-box-containing protein
VAGLGVSLHELERLGQRIDWDVWVELMLRLESTLGGPEALDHFISSASKGPGFHQFQRVAQLVSSPLALYQLNSRWGIPNSFRHKRSTCEELESGRLQVSISMPEGYRGSLPSFRCAVGVLRSLPTIIGLPESTVLRQEVSEHHARVLLQPPASRTLLFRARELGRRLRAFSSVSEQLGEQELELDEKRVALEHQLAEQKRIEAALRSSEERWRALAENAPGMILLLSSQGEITSVSRPFHGREPRTLCGSPLAELFAPGGRAELDAAIQAVRSELSVRDVQLHVASDGDGAREAWYSCRLGPMRADGGEVLLSAFLTDITLRLRAEHALREREAELVQAQKLEALGLLAGGVAHDFNNLLTVILGASELLLDSPGLAQPERADIQQIHQAGERASYLTHQLLAFSRQQAVSPAVMNLQPAIENFKDMLERLIGEGIHLDVRSQPGLWNVKVDLGQVEQILINLAVNARDAMPRGGTLTLAATNREIEAPAVFGGLTLEPGCYVELSIHDTGLGMDHRTSARIFEPFYSTKTEGRGTGLGLAIVRGIVSKSQGHVWVESELGRGSTFRLLFPRTGEPLGIEAPPLEVPPSRGSETILLVEDDASVRALTSKILRERGYRVIECAGAAEALRQAEAGFELLLTDVVMPEINGPELARLLVARHPGLAVLYMSGYAEHEMLQRGVAQPDVVSKPFGPEALATRVRSVLDDRTRKQRKSG